MIANSLIIPTEQPFSVQDVKRALLSYDKVYIPSPDDREMIPPNIYDNVLFASLGIDWPGMVGMPRGPIKPLGKTEDYDRQFEMVLKECQDAIDQGSIEILSTPEYEKTVTLGAIPMPEDTPNPYFTFLNYRTLSENQEFVELMSSGLEKLSIREIKDQTILLPSGLENEEQKVNDISRNPKIILDIHGRDKDESEFISHLCHTRLGILSKYLGYCNNKQLHPFTSDIGHAKVISQLEHNFIGTAKQIESSEAFIVRQKRITTLHNLIISEHVDNELIDGMSVNQILKQRTKAWGKNHEARNSLLNELNKIAYNSSSEEEFEKNCKISFENYLKVASDYRHEVDKLKLMLLFDANLFFFLKDGGENLLEKILKAPSMEILLAVGALGVVKYAREHMGGVLDIIKKAEEKREATGYAIYSNYKYVLK